MTKIELHHGDCLEIVPSLSAGAADLVLIDPPYGTIKELSGDNLSGGGMRFAQRNTVWDTTIPVHALMSLLLHALRYSGAGILFSQEPYTSQLIQHASSKIPFAYRCIWKKNDFANPLLVNKAPVSFFEDICVFRKENKNYDREGIHPIRAYAEKILAHIAKPKNRIFEEMGHQGACHFFRTKTTQFSIVTEKTYRQMIDLYGIDQLPEFMPYHEIVKIDRQIKEQIKEQFPTVFNLWEGKKHKSNVFEYKKDYTGHHPTQKPVLLLEDLIKTYSNPGDTVLDFTMGSGSTGVACVNTGRSFIGIEKDPAYFETAKERIAEAIKFLDA